MKKVLLSLAIIATLGAKAQQKVTLNLEDGKGLTTPITFIIESQSDYKAFDSKAKVDLYIELANVELMYSSKYPISYKPLQAKSNKVRYSKEKERLEVIIASSAKNSYGAEIEDTHMVAFEKGSIVSKLIF
jgi:hypothetical protein